MIGVSMPEYWSGIMAQLLFAFWISIFPSTGRFPSYPPPNVPPRVTGLLLVDSIIAQDPQALLTSIDYLILPAFILSLASIAQIMKFVRARMIEESGKDYVLTAKANGYPADLTIYKFMLKNAFSSTLTLLGLLYGFLLGGAFLVESVFAWPGIGRYLARSILLDDYAPIIGVVLVIGLGFVIVNLIIDALYGVLDPRVTQR
jgi:peptide/nickel transport system permease protein